MPQYRRGIVGIALAALVAGCSTGTSSRPAALAHIHGLGVDPRDGMLYAGTHYGVYMFTADGTADLVGDSTADYMGFTVAGAGQFLGSGHPAPEDAADSPHRGLIGSTDAGVTWQTLSLAGQADFHALDYRHGQVYGYDTQSGALLVSKDKRSWEARAAIPITDFAISPASPDDILATAAIGSSQSLGLVRSRDGGKTFEAVSGAPGLVLIAWPDRGPIVGVNIGGTVFVSDDEGSSWRQRQRVRPPQALVATTDAVYVATSDAIHRSTDGGKSFTTFATLD